MGMNTMECSCENLKKIEATYRRDSDQKKIRVGGLPAYQCRDCGKIHLEYKPSQFRGKVNVGEA